MGFFESLGKGWTFIKAAFQMAGRERKLLSPAVYLVLISILYWVGVVVAIVMADPVTNRWSNGTWALVSGGATFVAFLIFYFFCAMMVNMIDVYLKGGKPSLGEGARDAGKNFFALFALAIISTLVNMLTSALRRDRGIAGRIVAGIVDAIWTTFTFLLLPVIIIEDASIGKALKRVREVHKGNLLLIGVGEVGVRGVANLIGFVCFLAVFGIIWLAATTLTGTAALVVAFVAGGTVFSLFAAFNIYIRMAYYTCLYVWAAETEKARAAAEAGTPVNVKAPGPLGVALGPDWQPPIQSKGFWTSSM